MMDSYERVHEYLQKLHLSTMDGIIDTYLESSHDRPVMEILDHLLSEEVKKQKSRHVEARIRYSGLPFRKLLDDFDFTFQLSLDRKTIDDLMTLRFLHNHENVVFLGPPGVGKTHLSVSLALQAIYSGIPVYYVSAVKLVQTMKHDYDENRLHYRLSTYTVN
ncbi:MAG: hypothetical protein B2I17_07615 [Thermoplasmatales archaeon B_DKE]|nr:MAG: hypothetical protein B2I17_07615 [Thermoplasmatales archaeon B_DKE]